MVSDFAARTTNEASKPSSYSQCHCSTTIAIFCVKSPLVNDDFGASLNTAIATALQAYIGTTSEPCAYIITIVQLARTSSTAMPHSFYVKPVCRSSCRYYRCHI